MEMPQDFPDISMPDLLGAKSAAMAEMSLANAIGKVRRRVNTKIITKPHVGYFMPIALPTSIDSSQVDDDESNHMEETPVIQRP